MSPWKAWSRPSSVSSREKERQRERLGTTAQPFSGGGRAQGAVGWLSLLLWACGKALGPCSNVSATSGQRTCPPSTQPHTALRNRENVGSWTHQGPPIFQYSWQRLSHQSCKPEMLLPQSTRGWTSARATRHVCSGHRPSLTDSCPVFISPWRKSSCWLSPQPLAEPG